MTGPTIDPLAAAWHDVTCPEGPECRARHLHAMSGSAGTLPLIRLVVAAWLQSEDVRDTLTDHLYADAELGPGYMFKEDCEHVARRALVALDAVAGLCGGDH